LGKNYNRPAWRWNGSIFNNLQSCGARAHQLAGIGYYQKLSASRGLLRKSSAGLCTKSGHSPVDGLHSIENKRDKFARILLTLKTKRVELNRSLTAS